jgi:hypothetical protein
VNRSLWSDHTDIQPTMLALLGLRDDYAPDGRVLGEVMTRPALPTGMRPHRAILTRLGQVYTQLEAPVGRFGLATLRASTRALASHPATYTRIEHRLADLGHGRDQIAGMMRTMLLDSAFSGRPVNAAKTRALIRAGERLLRLAAALNR